MRGRGRGLGVLNGHLAEMPIHLKNNKAAHIAQLGVEFEWRCLGLRSQMEKGQTWRKDCIQTLTEMIAGLQMRLILLHKFFLKIQMPEG